ncbi:MAG: 1-(5-phosphoribosyl)-5-[(5-phosphoribosylamino)methylideneamino]imidazole-4-carboxamide isomerase [Alphaproteobacteria bacterium]|nr:1-(5-phosphoribosyl)-5-[(5-phosphoribosylamino)methylideneamino]imidazole-4-carboxamide isomerase [Alphaproteobacteria bacterium]
MIFFPAIDVKDGECVRLLHGDMNRVTRYQANPLLQAQAFIEAGAQYLHMVDLNGAVSGRASDNSSVIADMVQNIDIPVQLGGGIRTLAQVEDWLKIGVKRVILGTAAVKDPEFARLACQKFPNQIVLSIDARGENVALEGWVEQSDANIFDLANAYQDAGAAAIVYTDIARDGALEGVNLPMIQKMVTRSPLPIIASGGVTSLDDIAALSKIAGLEGMISGRALYEKKFTINDALKLLDD